MKVVIELEGDRFEVDVQRDADGVRVECEDAKMLAKGAAHGTTVVLEADKAPWRIEFVGDQRATINGRSVAFFVSDFAPGSPVSAAGAQARIPVRAVMHGRLVKVMAQPGQTVQKGEGLFVLEAMKMQNELASPMDGTVAEVVAKPGDVVEIGRVLAWLERRKA